MKVILLQDVKGTGKKGDLIDASDGHANNFLLPRKLAVEATKAHMSELENKKKAEEARRQRELLDAQELAKKLTDKPVRVSVKAGENGKVFGSVTSKEIAAAIEEQLGLAIDKKRIVVEEAIKILGEKKVDIKLHSQVTAKVTLEIAGI